MIAKQDCHLISISREAYLGLFKSMEHDQTLIRHDFIKSTLLDGSTMSKERELKIYTCITEHTLPHSHPLTRENDFGDFIYIIFYGSCYLKKKFNQSDLFKTSLRLDKLSRAKINQILDDRQEKFDYEFYMNIDYKSLDINLENLRTGDLGSEFKINDVGRGAILGTEILFNKTGCYEYSVFGEGDLGQVFGIRKGDFVGWITDGLLQNFRRDYWNKRECRVRAFGRQAEIFLKGNIEEVKGGDLMGDTPFLRKGEIMSNVKLVKQRFEKRLGKDPMGSFDPMVGLVGEKSFDEQKSFSLDLGHCKSLDGSPGWLGNTRASE